MEEHKEAFYYMVNATVRSNPVKSRATTGHGNEQLAVSLRYK